MPFRDLVGHARALSLLARAVARGTLPPSLLFTGPDGVGRRQAALAVAQALNCTDPIIGQGPFEHDACGRCQSCRKIGRGVHTDVLAVEPGEPGSIVIEQIRDAIDRAAYRPFEGSVRVVIVDPADAIVTPAQNALLKTLEEPPSRSVFVLITSRPDSLLPTVRSRCSQVRFGRLSAADIAGLLVSAKGYEPAAAAAAAATAEGSIALALTRESGELTSAREAARKLLENAAGADPRTRLASAKDLVGKPRATAAQDREQMSRRLRALASLLRDVEVLSTSADDRVLANADLKPGLEAMVKVFRGDRAVRAFSAVDRALAALERNASPKIVADWIAFQL